MLTAKGGREPLSIPNLLEDPKTKEMELTKIFKSYLGAPILGNNGSVIGTLCAIDSEPYMFSDDQIELLQDLAHYLSDIMMIDQHIQQKDRTEQLLQLQNNLLVKIATGWPYKDMINEFCVTVEHLMNGYFCSVLEYKEETNQLTLIAAPSLSIEYQQGIQLVDVGPNEGSCGTAAYYKKRVIVEDIETSPFWENHRNLALNENLRSCWSVPILSSKKELLGTFAIYSQQSKAPTQEELDIFHQFSSLVGIALEKEKTEKRIHFLAFHDELTQVANRISFREKANEHIKNALRQQSKLFLMIIDLDEFKEINDQYGHQSGDEVIKETAKRMVSNVAHRGLVARLGGDEFSIVLPGLSYKETKELATSLTHILGQPIEVQGKQLQITASIGISQIGVNGCTLYELQKYADTAMYRAKRAGKNQYCF
ncbi:diguanylate cyclase (GGDEF)-like protein [Bacillus mesophilus]|uniref:Diguanylate cyclase n=1 Tax=Bacillus mesophilus TaxID=1808955 RepID=A0A6M0QBS3_9BACI|nr:diguanylate cyclase [Bacillus mesophilus]MBM7660173.1 diguanylate cyclase (GGDEF)-like protein [Bacillus mesophilus]NEY73824.1 diguanylate cyclase [Bacillus mesophilus]